MKNTKSKLEEVMSHGNIKKYTRRSVLVYAVESLYRNMTDLVFVQSNKLGKEYEGNLFVGEKSYSRFILRSKQRKGYAVKQGVLQSHIGMQ